MGVEGMEDYSCLCLMLLWKGGIHGENWNCSTSRSWHDETATFTGGGWTLCEVGGTRREMSSVLIPTMLWKLPFALEICGSFVWARVLTLYHSFLFIFTVCHPEVFNTYINIQWSISQTQQYFIMFVIVLGQHVSILIESSSGPSKNTDPYLPMFKMYCRIQPLNTGYKSLNFRQEYNIDVGTISLNTQNIIAWFLMVLTF